MCGIVGYIGNKKAEPILLTGLKNLEYRGYDSAGFSILENNKFNLVKTPGRVSVLASLASSNPSNGTVGIAHTRWATHGKPTKENAHPHLDNSNTFSVVHNGIIENYNDLKIFLINNGCNFLSETDTEVIPNLIHYFYKQNNDFLNAVYKACNKLSGSFAINVICKNEPDKIIVAKKDSPLVIGKGNNENFISSDIPAVLEYTNEFYFINDFEFAEIYKDKINFYDSNLEPIQKQIQTISWNKSSSDLGNFEDYMLKEIHEQPCAIRETLQDFENTKYDFSINGINKIFIVACGTAMHAGLVGKSIIETLCRIPTEVEIASEFRYQNPIVDKNTLTIFISQSGETADTIAALKLAKEKGAKTLAITNVFGSSITRLADCVLYTKAGPEIAVASTKAYTAQVALITNLAINFASELKSYPEEKLAEFKKGLLSIPTYIEQILQKYDSLKLVAKDMSKESDIYYIGRGLDYPVAREGALKLKEISYIHAEAYASGELKHGAIALIEEGIHVISIITDPELAPKSISNVQEVISRGAKTVLITNQDIGKNQFDYVVKIPQIDKLLSPILSIIPLQLLAYYISKEKGLDVDKPRNLAKSVTVE